MARKLKINTGKKANLKMSAYIRLQICENPCIKKSPIFLRTHTHIITTVTTVQKDVKVIKLHTYIHTPAIPFIPPTPPPTQPLF